VNVAGKTVRRNAVNQHLGNLKSSSQKNLALVADPITANPVNITQEQLQYESKFQTSQSLLSQYCSKIINFEHATSENSSNLCENHQFSVATGSIIGKFSLETVIL